MHSTNCSVPISYFTEGVKALWDRGRGELWSWSWMTRSSSTCYPGGTSLSFLVWWKEIKGHKEAKLGLVRGTQRTGGFRDAGGAWFIPESWGRLKWNHVDVASVFSFPRLLITRVTQSEWGFCEGPWMLECREPQFIFLILWQQRSNCKMVSIIYLACFRWRGHFLFTRIALRFKIALTTDFLLDKLEGRQPN